MIRPAKISEFSEIPEIVKTCAQQIMQNVIFQWNEHYPAFIAFERYIQRAELHVLEVGERLWAGSSFRLLWICNTLILNGPLDQKTLHTSPIGKSHNTLGKDMPKINRFYLRTTLFSFEQRPFARANASKNFIKHVDTKRLGDIYFPKQSELSFHYYGPVL